MAQISMEPSAVIECGQNIKNSASEYNQKIEKIYSIVADLKNAWTGSAASRFTDKIESCEEEYKKFGTLINDFGALLEAIGKDYQNLEENL